jgi:hypothetical protein
MPLTKFDIFPDKSSEESRNRRKVPQHNKSYIGKPIANTVLNGRKTEVISSKVRSKTRRGEGGGSAYFPHSYSIHSLNY